MIVPGLSRISKLFPASKVRWKAVHVAGTNGKGSVCAYTAAMLASRGVSVGRFTSPHLIDRHDCIQINGKAVHEELFKEVEDHFKEESDRYSIDATEFEILTATAFEIFNRSRVEIGVVEVGVGGREDATNIFNQDTVACSVITRIAMDHQSLLGDSIDEIIEHKVGIARRGVPCIFAGGNGVKVLKALQRLELRSPLEQITEKDEAVKLNYHGPFGGPMPEHQKEHIFMASKAAQYALHAVRRHAPAQELVQSVECVQWPGRLQAISLEPLTGRKEPVLLDGAHNEDSARVLAGFMQDNERVRKNGEPITWVLAMSIGKNINGMLDRILWDQDRLVTVEFGPVDGMPWVESTQSAELLRHAQSARHLSNALSMGKDVEKALQKACELCAGGPLVIAGSLYLVSDVLRLLRNAGVQPQEWETIPNFNIDPGVETAKSR